ncbi:acyl-CoA thioesterase [Deinococcus sp.]|uniref:acyl-CoA thioesterase n=1 Tax=Deinococcus sp. TaxID=47478 RepID=UPI003CC53F63
MTDVLLADAFPLACPLRVRWAEVDAQGVVFNGHYLSYADLCCTEYFRAAGLPLWSGPNPEAEALDAYVVRATLDYQAPARFDDLLTLRGRVARLGRSSFTFGCRIEREGALLCRAELIYVNARAGASQALPDAFRAAVLAYQGAAP